MNGSSYANEALHEKFCDDGDPNVKSGVAAGCSYGTDLLFFCDGT